MLGVACADRCRTPMDWAWAIKCKRGSSGGAADSARQLLRALETAGIEFIPDLACD